MDQDELMRWLAETEERARKMPEDCERIQRDCDKIREEMAKKRTGTTGENPVRGEPS